MSDYELSLRVVILHTRPYRESSLIVDCFSESHGRLSFLAKSIRSRSGQMLRSALQMGSVLDVNLIGRSELKTLKNADIIATPHSFSGDLYAMSTYLSEILLRLTQPYDAHPEIYPRIEHWYRVTSLEDKILLLREIELVLIQELGVSISFTHDIVGEPIQHSSYYSLHDNEGFSRSESNGFLGEQLLNIADGRWGSEQTRQTLKHVNRMLLKPMLGERPLKSRELWQSWQARTRKKS